MHTYSVCVCIYIYIYTHTHTHTHHVFNNILLGILLDDYEKWHLIHTFPQVKNYQNTCRICPYRRRSTFRGSSPRLGCFSGKAQRNSLLLRPPLEAKMYMLEEKITAFSQSIRINEYLQLVNTTKSTGKLLKNNLYVHLHCIYYLCNTWF